MVISVATRSGIYKLLFFVDHQQPRSGLWKTVRCRNTLEVIYSTDDADVAGRGEQETQQTTIYGGQIRVKYRDDGIVIPGKERRTSFEL